MDLLRTLRLRLRALFRPDALHREVEEELQLHIDMQTEENIRAGMAPEEARRRAVLLFGGVEGHKDASRRAQGLELMGARASWLDFKLGLRMLVKYPGLTVVGGLALVVATALGAAFFQFSENMVNIRLPFEDADRMVTIRNWDVEAASPDHRAIADFVRWRDEVESIGQLGAMELLEQTVTTEDGYSESFDVTRTTATALEITGVEPILGRPILPEDERPDAPPVAVIGYDVWERLFDLDRGVIGRTVRLGATTATVVGVMPDGFGYPSNESLWAPLRTAAMEHGPREGPAIRVVGRLRPGVSLEEAQAELAAIGARMAADFPETHRRLQPRVLPLADAIMGDGDMRTAVQALRLVFILLMVVMCVNVATLVFARTAARETEFAVRSALGASRRRIVLQLFLEALALTLTAAAIGLAAAWLGLRWGMALFWEVQEMAKPPFYFTDSLSPATIAYAVVLALVGAFMVGVVPALKVTGKRVQPTLSQMSAGSPQLRFGGVWTVIVVIQVALSVAFLPTAVDAARSALEDSERISGFPADSYLTGRLTRELPTPPSELPEAEQAAELARSMELLDEVKRRVAAEPGVAAVTFADRASGMNHGLDMIHVHEVAEPVPSDTAAGPMSRRLAVDLDYFEVMRAPIVSGRTFGGDDVASGTNVIVNQQFVDLIMGGRDPVGHRIRYPRRPDGEAERWYEVVGVVGNPDVDAYGPGQHPAIYHPITPEHAGSMQMFVLAGGQAPTVGPRIRSTINAIDPSLRLGELVTVGDVWRPVHRSEQVFAAIQALVAMIALLLSMAGIHALMSFTVSRRTREIGIRAAMGAKPARIVAVIFSRAFAQLGLGVLIGSLLAYGLKQDESWPGMLLVIVVTMLTVGLLACYLPARRALRIHPTEALKSGG